MKLTGQQSKAAASSGYWPMYRFNPAHRDLGQNPFVWESEEISPDFVEYTTAEVRYRALELSQPEEACACETSPWRTKAWVRYLRNLERRTESGEDRRETDGPRGGPV